MFELTLRLCERALRIRCDHPAIHTYVERAFGRLRAAPSEAAALAYTDEVTVRWSGTLAPAIGAIAQALATSFRALHRHRAVYAAGLCADGTALLLAAPSGTGKTTVCLELLRRGWQTYGDEFVLLERRTLRAYPFEQAFAVRERSLDRLRSAALYAACAADPTVTHDAGGRTWHGIDVAATFGEHTIAHPRPLTHVVYMTPSTDGRTTLAPAAPAACALRLIPHLYVESLQIADVWETIEGLARLACYELSIADARTAADLLAQLARCAA